MFAGGTWIRWYNLYINRVLRHLSYCVVLPSFRSGQSQKGKQDSPISKRENKEPPCKGVIFKSWPFYWGYNIRTKCLSLPPSKTSCIPLPDLLPKHDPLPLLRIVCIHTWQGICKYPTPIWNLPSSNSSSWAKGLHASHLIWHLPKSSFKSHREPCHRREMRGGSTVARKVPTAQPSGAESGSPAQTEYKNCAGLCGSITQDQGDGDEKSVELIVHTV